jgi:hypothetical protein
MWLCYSPLKRRLAKIRAFREWILAETKESVGTDRWGVLHMPDNPT